MANTLPSITEKLTAESAEALATKWGTTSRTIYAWRKRGIDLKNPAAVVDFIIASKNPSMRQLSAAVDNLAEIPRHNTHEL